MTICELYHFDFEGGPDFRYTSAEVDISYDGHTWEASKITRGRPPARMVGESSRSTLDLEMDGITTDVVRQWDGGGPSSEVRVTIYVASREDIAGTIMQVFPGVVQSISGQGKRITITASLRSSGSEKKGPRGHFSTRCRHALYGPGCKVDIDTIKVQGTATFPDPMKNELTVVIDQEFGDANDLFFLGGALLFGGSGRRIISQGPPSSLGGGLYEYPIEIAYWIDGLESQSAVEIAWGCDRSFAHCASRFGNIENFGGFTELANVLASPFRYGWRYKDPRGSS